MSKSGSFSTSNSEIFTDDDDDEVVEDSFIERSSHRGGVRSNSSEPSAHNSSDPSAHNSSVEVSDSGSDVEPIRRPKKKTALVSESEDEENGNGNEQDSDAAQRSDHDSDSDEDFIERRALSPRTRMSITGFRPRDFTDDESDISDSGKSSVHSAFSDEDELHSFDPENPIKTVDTKPDSKLEDNANTSQEFLPDEEIKAEKTVSLANGTENFPRRISSNFNHSIANKLSSTILDTNSPQIPKNESNQCFSVSDSPVVQSEQAAIELSSGSDSSLLEISTPTLKPLRTVQPKIIGVLDLTRQEKKFTGDAKTVSQKFMDEQLKKLNDLRSELATCENLVNTLGTKLPDKGKRMSGRSDRLRSEIADLAQYITTLKVEDGLNMSAKDLLKANTLLPKAPTWEELTSAANSIQPKYTGKVGMANFIAQKTLTIERLKDIHGSLESCPDENILADEPKNLKISLMQHQRHALTWMYWREKQKPRGGILADDMGLGKTLTMISLILASKERAAEDSQDESDDDDDDDDDNNTGGWSAKGRKDYYRGGTLIICPASLIRQWESEVSNRVKSNKITVSVYHGNNREAKPRTLAKYDMVVTTYNLVPREMNSHGSLFSVKWDRIILDEAHIIRNHKSKASEAVCKLRGKHRWVLTGTPIQNKEMDLYALLKFLKCTPFDELAHWKKWIDNKSAGGQQRLNTLIKSLMLRRTKLQLQEFGTLTLPEKLLHVVEVSLENDEMNVYQKIMLFSKTLFAQFLYQRAERNNDFAYQSEGNKPTFAQSKDPNGAYYKMHQKFSRLDKNSEVKSTDILVLLLRLRQICCHPGLIDSMLEEEDQVSQREESDETSQEIDLLDQLNKLQINDDSTNTSQDAENLNNTNEKAISKTLSKALLKTNPVFDFKRPSSKMKKVIEILEQKILNTNDKAIIVSQWTSVLNILKEHLSAKRIPVVCLNGSVPVKLRNDIVNDFNNQQSNKRIMLLSLTAGGVGLNLIGANHLLLFDLHWNPQLEAQAQDRIYRVGQKKTVNIYKFMCKETVEERIKTLQDHKLAIANGVLTGVKGSEGSKLSIDDLKSLFGL